MKDIGDDEYVFIDIVEEPERVFDVEVYPGMNSEEPDTYVGNVDDIVDVLHHFLSSGEDFSRIVIHGANNDLKDRVEGFINESEDGEGRDVFLVIMKNENGDVVEKEEHDGEELVELVSELVGGERKDIRTVVIGIDRNGFRKI